MHTHTHMNTHAHFFCDKPVASYKSMKYFHPLHTGRGKCACGACKCAATPYTWTWQGAVCDCPANPSDCFDTTFSVMGEGEGGRWFLMLCALCRLVHSVGDRAHVLVTLLAKERACVAVATLEHIVERK